MATDADILNIAWRNGAGIVKEEQPAMKLNPSGGNLEIIVGILGSAIAWIWRGFMIGAGMGLAIMMLLS